MPESVGNNSRVDKVAARLQAVYKKIPQTKGCLDHIDRTEQDGGCNAWCCRLQSPQVLYVGFLNAWKHIISEWPYHDILDLIEKAIKDYLNDSPTKGCIFLNEDNNNCNIHGVRPLSCRVYGITPEEEFNPRVERLRVIYKDKIDAVFRDQCDLVSTVNGKKVTQEDTDGWWEKTVDIEEEFVERENIHDEVGGSYRRYSEHILLHLFQDDILQQLQVLRQFGKFEEKTIAVKSFIKVIQKNLQSILQNQEDA